MRAPEPTTGEPNPGTMMAWADDGGCQATDGCWLDADTPVCPHGCQSWAIVLGFVAREPAD